jgi:hypothetical protein
MNSDERSRQSDRKREKKGNKSETYVKINGI